MMAWRGEGGGALAARIALWRRILWIRVRRGTLVEEWRRLSLLERETEVAIREGQNRPTLKRVEGKENP
jgi:hypothetical protein